MDTTYHSEIEPPPSVAKAMTATADFLTKTLKNVERVDVVNVTPLASGEAAWEAEANVWQPNEELKSLGLHTFRPVLEHCHYVVRLDAQLNILEYELHEPAHA
jgi:hypothetical protein